MGVRLIYISLVLYLYIGCQYDNDPLIYKIGEVKYETGYLSNHRFVDIFCDIRDGKDYIYFGEPTTKKLITVFDMFGKRKVIIPLDNVIKKINTIENIKIISWDTILIFGAHNNKIANIDSLGNIRSIIMLDKRVKYGTGEILEHITSQYSEFYSNGTLYFKNMFVSASKESEVPQVNSYFGFALNIPYFLKVQNLISIDDIKYTFGLDSFYRRFMSDSIAMSEPAYFSLCNEKIVVFSIFTDTLYIVDTAFLKIMNKIKIVSSYSKLFSKPFNVNKLSGYQEYLNYILKNNGSINRVYCNPINNNYIIIALHENKQDPKLERTIWTYSVIIYTDEGKKIGEQLLEDAYLIPAATLLYKGNLYISTNSLLNPGYNEKIEKYDIYKLPD